MAALSKQQLASMSLDELYKHANFRYWDAELPDIPVTWNDKLEAKLGIAKMHLTSKSNGLSIELSSLLKNDPEKLLNVLVHEQIHIWCYSRYLATGNEVYLDKKNNRRIEGHRKGHGKYFHSQKDRLESQFPEIAISVRDDFDHLESGVEGKQRYGALLEFRDSRGGEHQCIFHSEANIFGSMSELSEALSDIYGAALVDQITPFVTEDPRVVKGVRLTNKGLPRKGAGTVSTRAEFVDTIVNSELTDIDWSSRIDLADLTPAVDPKLSARQPALKPFIGGSFPRYLGMAFTRGAGLVKDSFTMDDAKQAIAGEHPEVDSSSVDYLFDQWCNASPADFFRKGAVLDLVVKSIARASTMPRVDIKKDGLRHNFETAWRSAGGPVRLPWETAVKHFEKSLNKEMRKKVKDPQFQSMYAQKHKDLCQEVLSTPPENQDPAVLMDKITADRGRSSRDVFAWSVMADFKAQGIEPPSLDEARQRWDNCSLEESMKGSGKEILGMLEGQAERSLRRGSAGRPDGLVKLLREHSDAFIGRGSNYSSDEGVAKIIETFRETQKRRLDIENNPADYQTWEASQELIDHLHSSLSEAADIHSKPTNTNAPGYGQT